MISFSEMIRLSAVLSEAAYADDAECALLLDAERMTDIQICDVNGSRAVMAEFDDVVFIAFAGTNASDIRDLLADVRFIPTFHRSSFGFVHRGFEWYEEILADCVSVSHECAKRMVICGHSLGGALAVMAAARIGDFRMRLGLSAPDVVTFGAPLVGSAGFCDHVESVCRSVVRVTNDNDPVPRLALWPVYLHPATHEIHFDANGIPCSPSLFDRVWNSSRGLLKFPFSLAVSIIRNMSVLDGFIESMSIGDHFMSRYRGLVDVQLSLLEEFKGRL